MRPGHVLYAPRLMAASHVCLTGYPAVAWRYAMSAGVFGRSSVFTSCRVVVHGGLFCTSKVFVTGVGVCVGELFRTSTGCVTGVGVSVGAILTRHKRAPVCSRSPWSILFPFLSCTSRMRLSKYAVQSSSQSLPRLRRLLVKPGMMWPVRAVSDCMAGMASTAAPADVVVSPVAVLIVVLGALTLMLMRGAVGMK